MKDPVDVIDGALLKIACPENSLAELNQWVPHVKAACRRWGIDTVREVAAFLAQCGHESQGFTRLEENLNYSASRLRGVWPSRFPTLASATLYANSPRKLANYVYGGRNGNTQPDDGWTFRGGGLIHLTGRNKYTGFADAMKMPLASVIPYTRTREGACMAAGWFWKTNNLDALAATPGVEDETRKINGGLNGVDDRRKRFNALINEMLRRGC